MSAANDTVGMQLRVADSFRVRRASGAVEVRGFPHHIERFTASVMASCADLGAELLVDELNEFLADAASRIAAYGEGNPRLELWGVPGRAPQLRLALRPLPELRTSIELRATPGVSTAHPDRKGPNIELFTRLNQELGAEALLTSIGGGVLEGATTAIIWWRGEQGHVASTPQRVSSITEQLISSIAQELGCPLTPAHITSTELVHREVWAVNALHGIRPVSHIDGVRLPMPDPHRLQAFHEALDRTWTAVII